ncbi:hypothetical protein TNCV_3999341 [Trichonephila clavipes]|nr:hypothetical protein TNCV_3999341 [Trichonephila clavipes]
MVSSLVTLRAEGADEHLSIEAQTSSRWCIMEVRRGGASSCVVLVTVVQNDEVRRKYPRADLYCVVYVTLRSQADQGCCNLYRFKKERNIVTACYN